MLLAALPFEVAKREIRIAKKLLDWPDDAFAVRELPEDQGPGNILLLEAAFENVTEIVGGFGKLGVSAEQVAKTAAARMAGYLASDALAGPYLADQLLLPFALAGDGRSRRKPRSSYAFSGGAARSLKPRLASTSCS